MKETGNLTLRYSLIQGAVWMGYAPIIGFTSVYLIAKGSSNTEIGLIVAVGGIASALLQSVIATYADKEGSLSLKQIVYIISSVLLLAAGGLLLFSGTRTAEIILFGMLVTTIQISVPFVNALGMHSINQGKELNYGFARGMGSIGFAVLSFILGKGTDKYGPDIIPFSVIIVSFILFSATLSFPFKREKENERVETKMTENSKSFAKKYPMFMLFLAGSVLTFVGHNLINTYLFQIMLPKGGTEAEMGTAIGIAAFMELPALFAFSLIIKRFKSTLLVRIGSGIMFLKILATFLAPNVAALYAVQIFQMLGYALYVVAAAYYVNEVTERSDRIKGQAYVTAASTLGVVLSSVSGGCLIDAFNVTVMNIFGIGVAFLGFAIVVLSTVDRKRGLGYYS